MLTFKPIIVFGNKRKDGTWAVYVRVTFKGVSRRVSTPLVCTSADLTRSGRIKSGEVLDRADEIVRQMRKAAGTIAPFDLEGMDVDGILSRIRSRLAGDGFVLDFFAWADVFIQTKTPMTQDVYRTALNAFSRYLGKRSVDINGISRAMLAVLFAAGVALLFVRQSAALLAAALWLLLENERLPLVKGRKLL